MADINIVIENLPELKINFRNYPKITVSWLNKAIKASVQEIKKNATDVNFQFKTPRSKRTGLLQSTWGLEDRIADLYAKTGPTRYYAPFVYYGTSRGISPNPYMDRILKAANPSIQRFFREAVIGIAKDLSHV